MTPSPFESSVEELNSYIEEHRSSLARPRDPGHEQDPPIVSAFALLLLAGCSGSKSYSGTKGEKLDEAGLYAEAADMYLQAGASHAKNTDAKIGLKKTAASAER
ncbi:MAG: hypothetical protein R2818_04120 [Flavobacteriales bacterium]